MGRRGSVTELLLTKVKSLVLVQSVEKDPPFMNSLRPSRSSTSEPRSAHISLFQEPYAQTFSLPPLPKHVYLTLSREGNLERWPGQCLWEERAEEALKFDLPRDPVRPCSGPHKTLPLLQDSDAGKEDGNIGAEHAVGRDAAVCQGMEINFAVIFWQELQPTTHRQKVMNGPLEWILLPPLPAWYHPHQTPGRSP